MLFQHDGRVGPASRIGGSPNFVENRLPHRPLARPRAVLDPTPTDRPDASGSIPQEVHMFDPIASHVAWIIDLAAINADIDRSGLPAPLLRPASKRQRPTKRAPWWEE